MRRSIRLLKKILTLFIAVLVVQATEPLQTIFGAEIGSFATDNRTIEVNNHIVHHLSDDGVCGATNYIGDNIDYEGLAGLKVHCEGTTVEYTMYSHLKCYSDGIISIQDITDSNTKIELGNITTDETKSFDMNKPTQTMGLKITTGLYKITLMIGENYKEPVSMYLYYDGNKVQTGRCNSRQYDFDSWNHLVGRLDPNTCLNMWVGNESNPITYPTSGTNGSCNHVQVWCDKSDEIIKKDEWSDEAKVFALVYWMSRNLAYDDYRVKTLDNVSRAMTEGKWNDDNLFTYGNHVGQCWDFANILTIMCRHHGIPCTTVENDHHTINAVWLRNEWVGIDVSELTNYHCYDKDSSKDNWVKQRSGSYTEYYGYFDDSMDTYNQAIATPETTLVGKSGENPL